MDIPSSDAPCWSTLLTGAAPPACGHLAVQMMIFRLRQSVGQDASSANLAKAIGELHAFFTTNIHQPAVQQDLAAIRGVGP